MAESFGHMPQSRGPVCGVNRLSERVYVFSCYVAWSLVLQLRVVRGVVLCSQDVTGGEYCDGRSVIAFASTS